jgi:hypothetical protein
MYNPTEGIRERFGHRNMTTTMTNNDINNSGEIYAHAARNHVVDRYLLAKRSIACINIYLYFVKKNAMNSWLCE